MKNYFATTALWVMASLWCSDGAAQLVDMNEADQAGIRRGIVTPGMTRRGVIFAIGYPPRHVNPSVEFGDWTYWRHRFDRFIVRFDENDLVIGIVN